MTLSARSLRYVAPFVALLLLGQGCGTPAPAGGPDGGVFRTKDAGLNWKQMKILNAGKSLGSIADVGTVTMSFDPQDQQTIYVGTMQNGLLFSLDGGESWTNAKGFSVGRVNAVAVDPKQKCTVYATRLNQIWKTDNCLRDWNQIYFNPRTDVSFTAVAVDWYNAKNLLAGSTDGDIFRSADGGATWTLAHRLDGARVTTIAMDPRDSRLIYASTEGNGIAKSTDGGVTWEDIYKPFQAFERARNIHALTIDPNLANTLYVITKYGVLKSEDGAATWTALNLPTPPGTVDIRAFSINPKDSKQIVYATDSSIVFSLTSGATWTPKKLPTKRPISFVKYDSAADQSLFLGALPVPQK